MIAYAWASGLIQYGDELPEGAICLFPEIDEELIEQIEVRATHAYDGVSLLVPGVAEAETEEQGLDAVTKWLKWFNK